MSWRLRLSVETIVRLTPAGGYADGGGAESVAGQLKVSPEALAETAVRDLLARPDDEFLKVAKTVVEENRELYERLR